MLGCGREFASSLVVADLMVHRRAAEKLLMGEPYAAEEGVESGVANAVVPADEVLPHARRVAERFNALPPSAVRQSKHLMKRWTAEGVMASIGAEAEVFGKALRSAEAREAFQAFFEKRKPDFSKF